MIILGDVGVASSIGGSRDHSSALHTAEPEDLGAAQPKKTEAEEEEVWRLQHQQGPWPVCSLESHWCRSASRQRKQRLMSRYGED